MQFRNNLDLDAHFTKVPNSLIRDARLSPKARLLWIWMMSHRTGWQCSIDRLASQNGIGVDAARTGVKELTEAGWLRRSAEQTKGPSGEFTGYVYDLEIPSLDYPRMDNPSVDNPSVGDPRMDDPLVENQTPKKTTGKKTNLQEDQSKEPPVSPRPGTSPARVDTEVPQGVEASVAARDAAAPPSLHCTEHQDLPAGAIITSCSGCKRAQHRHRKWQERQDTLAYDARREAEQAAFARGLAERDAKASKDPSRGIAMCREALAKHQ